MNRSELQKQLDNIGVQLKDINDPKLKATFILLLNVIEQLFSENEELREENRRLRDEINRLKGEQGRPTIRAQKKDNVNFSSEQERKGNHEKNRHSNSANRKENIQINRKEVCKVDKTELPIDAVFKGYETVVVQDIIIVKDNIEFRKEIYYSPSLNKRFTGSLPKGYKGRFGSGIKTLVLNLYYSSGMTELAIKEFLNTCEIYISKATISRFITDNKEQFHQEKQEIIQAGLQATEYQHIDDTGARVNGKNYHTHVLCNPFYAAYFTMPKRDRLTVLKITSQNDLKFCFNEEAYILMERLGISKKTLRILNKENGKERILVRKEVDELLLKLFPEKRKYQTIRQIILDASAIVAYRQREDVIRLFICDDAPQFKNITEELGLCWVHEGRHYKKLSPIVMMHREILNNFLKNFWDYYKELLDYKLSPNKVVADKLQKKFEQLFSEPTGYQQLDERNSKTLGKKKSLLLVLNYPEIPLHNNPAELDLRVQTRRRDINLQTRNEKGTEAKDTFMTIIQTARKLGVNSYQYLYDRISQSFEMPSLSSMIISTAHNENLGYNTS
jgi:hypothetical protein